MHGSESTGRNMETEGGTEGSSDEFYYSLPLGTTCGIWWRCFAAFFSIPGRVAGLIDDRLVGRRNMIMVRRWGKMWLRLDTLAYYTSS